MNRYNLSLIVLIFFMGACRQQADVKQLMDINKSLEFSNEVIQNGTRLIYEELQNKLHDLEANQQAAIWQPRATEIQKHATSIRIFIDGLKKKLIEQSDSLKDMDHGLVKQIFFTNGNAQILFNKLAVFKDSIPAIFGIEQIEDNDLRKTRLTKDIGQLTAHTLLLAGYTDSVSEKERGEYAKNWVQHNFTGSSLMAMLALNKIENDVLTTEKTLTEYCYNQTATHDCGLYYSFSAIATLSSSYVKPGQPIEVNAGIGSFNAASKPAIMIDGKIIKLNNDATAVYNFTANGKPGKHIVPVKISFTKPDGSTATVLKNLGYIIAE
jgi:gliding motility-associated GldM-like protein